MRNRIPVIAAALLLALTFANGIGMAIRSSLRERCNRVMWRGMSTNRPPRISQTS